MELKVLNSAGFNRLSLIISALSLLAVIFLGATYDEIVSDKNRQIDRVQKLIEESNQEKSGNSKRTASLNRSIDSVNTALKALSIFLKDYKGETYLSADQIAIETNMVIFLEEDVDRIQKSLKNKIISLYKHGKNYDLELLLSSKSPNEFLRRNEYLQKFAQNRKKQLQELRSKEYTLAEKKKMLDLFTSSRRFYVESKRNEQAALQEKLKGLNTEKSN